MSGTNKSIGKIIVWMFLIVVGLLNAALTFLFGGQYGSETFPTAYPFVSWFLGGLMLTVFYDFAAYAWFVARSKHAKSSMQRGLASILAGMSMVFSIMASAAQLLLTTTLMDFSSWHSSIGISATWIMIIAAAAHFGGIFAYKFYDPNFAEEDAESEMMAEANSFRLKQKQRVAKKMFKRVEQIMDGELDDIAEAEAAALWSHLLPQLRTSPRLEGKQPAIIEGEKVEGKDSPAHAPTRPNRGRATKPPYTPVQPQPRAARAHNNGHDAARQEDDEAGKA